MTVDDIQLAPPAMHTTQRTGFGRRLKLAREALQLSEKDVATRLHLTLKLITTIETEDFVNGPPAIFMRGYLRSYARLLNITEAEVNQAFTQLDIPTPLINSPHVTLYIPKQQTRHHYNRWITYLIVVLLVTLVGIWWYNHTYYTAPNTNNPLATPPAPANIITTPAIQPAPTPFSAAATTVMTKTPVVSRNMTETKQLPLTSPQAAIPSQDVAKLPMALPEPELESPEPDNEENVNTNN